MTRKIAIVFAVEPVAGGFAVTANTRAIKTPAGRALAVPNEPLAQAIAAEFDAHGIKASSAARLRRMAVAAIDRGSDGAALAVAGVAGYAKADLLCYRAEAAPELAQRQADAWQPLLDWAAATYGAHLAVTAGVVPLDQEAGALAKMHDAVAALDSWRLPAVAAASVTTGSLVLGLALAEGRVDVGQAWRLCRLDHDYQAERWGADDEAQAAAAHVRDDLTAAARFLQLLAG
jgi:chaperone required for assembly of F1-ATPase